MNKMFRGLNTQGSTTNSDDNSDDTIYLTCQPDLIRYLTDVNSGACPMENDHHSFNDPLKWWKDNHMKYSMLQTFLENSMQFLPHLCHLNGFGAGLQEFFPFAVQDLRMTL